MMPLNDQTHGQSFGGPGGYLFYWFQNMNLEINIEVFKVEKS